MGHSSFYLPDHKRRRGDQDDGRCNPAQIRTGGGVIPWVFVQAHVSSLCMIG